MIFRKRLDVHQIVTQAGMSDRPGFYSGRGATLADLDYKRLEQVYLGIRKEYGRKPAQQFVQMVADIPKLTATDFLLTLYGLERWKWKWDKMILGSQRGIYPEDEGSALGTIASVIGGLNETDHTDEIRREFLKKYGTKMQKQALKREGPVNFW